MKKFSFETGRKGASKFWKIFKNVGIYVFRKPNFRLKKNFESLIVPKKIKKGDPLGFLKSHLGDKKVAQCRRKFKGGRPVLYLTLNACRSSSLVVL